MIRLQDVSKLYGQQAILQNLQFHLGAGEFAFLQGRSGSGKSTLLKLLYRDIEDFSGQIEINGAPITQIPKYELRRQMGIIFQSFELLERKTVKETWLWQAKSWERRGSRSSLRPVVSWREWA
ncbi:ATP-binding cassette domain-containing protein [Brevibacillus centrosporus]|uniref:ATP-binding cassette domain-containing protein n=1 Tax=Brevibacillus centrosporus TaxID=54910 RepID=UPI0039867D5F